MISPRLPDSWRECWQRKYTLVAIVLLFLVSLFVQRYTLPGTDLAWLSWGVDEWLKGGVLYKDILEPNPPLVYWLYAPVIMLANHYGWPLVVSLRMATLLLAALCLFLCAAVLRTSSLWQGKERQNFLMVIAGFLLIAPDSLTTFAQREHLLILLALPYLLLRLPSVQPKNIPLPLHIFMGGLAGIGFCIKPHFLLIWLALLLYRLVSTRSLRAVLGAPEAAIIVVIGLYIAAVFAFAPQWFDWMHLLIPIYGANGMVGQTNLEKTISFIVLSVVAAVIAWQCQLLKIPRAAAYRPDIIYLLCIAAGAFLEALVQFKTWRYIPYPWEVLGMLAVSTMILFRPLTGLFAIGLMTYFFYPITPLDDPRQEMFHRQYALLMQQLEPYKRSDDVYYISLNFAPPQLYRTSAPLRWSDRFGFFHFLVMGMMEQFPDTLQPNLTVRPGREGLERRVLDNVAEDMEQKKPGLIVIERFYVQGEPVDQTFDFVAWFKKDARLARIMRRYTMVKDVVISDDPSDPKNLYRHNYRIFTLGHSS